MTPEPRSGHAPVRIGMAGADVNQVTAVNEFLERHGVYSEWQGDVLIVPAHHEYSVRQAMIDAVPPARVGVGRAAPADATVFEPAPPWVRLLAAVIDEIVLVVVSLLVIAAQLSILDDRPALVAVTIWLATWLIVVVPVARWGWTVGKVLTRIRVFELDHLTPPGIARALARQAVPSVPWLAVSVVYGFGFPRAVDLAVAVVAWLANVAIYIPILTNSDRRGWHDRIARTIVVRPAPQRNADRADQRMPLAR